MELLAIPLILILIILSPIAIWFAFPEYRIYVIIFGVVIAIRLLARLLKPLFEYIQEKKRQKARREEIARQNEKLAEQEREWEEEIRKRQEEEQKRQEEIAKRAEEARKKFAEEMRIRGALRKKQEEEERRRRQEEEARHEEAVRRWQQMLDNLPSNMLEVYPQDFFALKKSAQEFTGVYILHNESKDMYYVGQSVRVLSRVSQHFTGHGNGDVYADFKYGDTFTIRCLSLANSGYDSLDELEKDFIQRYDANITGYNRTQGNTQKGEP